MRGREQTWVRRCMSGASELGLTERRLQRLIFSCCRPWLWAVSLQDYSQLMRSALWKQGWTCVFLYTPLPEPSLPGLALFILPTYDLSATYNSLWEKHGASFHHRRTGGSEYWEKGRLLHDFAYWLLAKNGRCAYWMQRSFYSHIQVSPSLSSLAEYRECTILHAIHVSSFPLPPMSVHFLTFMLFISLFYTV